MPPRTDLQAQGDRDLRERLLSQRSVTAAIAELERLLGLGSVPPELKPDAILADLPSRIDIVRDSVPPLRRAQVIRDLYVVARADGHVTEQEIDVIRSIAESVEVDLDVVNATLDSACAECASAPR